MKKETLDIPELGLVVVTTNKRAKNIRLNITSGELRVTKPPYVSRATVVAFIDNNHSWAQKKLEESLQAKLINDGDVLAPETAVSFTTTTNSATTIMRVLGGLEVRLAQNAEPADKDVQEAIVEAMVPIWRKEAKSYLPSRLDELASTYNFRYKKLQLKNIHSRWGSCSSSKNINLNIQLMKLNEELIDHVLLHELSHTKALNHGADFWKVFESVRPGAREERKQLKQMIIF